MKRIILTAAIGLGVFTVITSSANSHVVTTPFKTIVSDTDTTKKPYPDTTKTPGDSIYINNISR